jgi:hypothetical protein
LLSKYPPRLCVASLLGCVRCSRVALMAILLYVRRGVVLCKRILSSICHIPIRSLPMISRSSHPTTTLRQSPSSFTRVHSPRYDAVRHMLVCLRMFGVCACFAHRLLSLQLWWKQDARFHTPKAHSTFLLSSPFASTDPFCYNATCLVAEILEVTLSFSQFDRSSQAISLRLVARCDGNGALANDQWKFISIIQRLRFPSIRISGHANGVCLRCKRCWNQLQHFAHVVWVGSGYFWLQSETGIAYIMSTSLLDNAFVVREKWCNRQLRVGVFVGAIAQCYSRSNVCD